MKFWVGVTDGAWFRFLSDARPDEVNFWQPKGAVEYRQLDFGAPFLFKLKAPDNAIAGGGFFVRATALPAAMTWDVFGTKNGTPDVAGFMQAIRRLSSKQHVMDHVVGSTVLANPFFWPRERWIELPSSWRGNIVRGRYYDTDDPDGWTLWQQVADRLAAYPIVAESQPRYGAPQAVQPRLGQGAFRVLVTDAYQRRCAITGESTLPVLDAAHIVPYAENGPHRVDNGLLLRSDFHKLFDLGLVTITPDLRVEVSSRIREEWFNGKAYYRLHGERLKVEPQRPDWKPSPAHLAWHNEHRFRA